jgi:hypothetical protein
MKFTIYKKQEEVEFDIEFPIYTKWNLSDHHIYIIYKRVSIINQKYRLDSITITDESVEMEIIDNYTFPPINVKESELDFYLSKNQYKSNALEFNLALSKAKQVITLIENN